ncbi:conjugal transfer pilus assembly protein TraU [Croceicoccus naphthovorans]|uniref:Conjugal transfer protein n=1 Tax=Croceicoccus naphthovorans TaxID=1348774 RepID=A0A0G3XM17_9SPHN|nr:conjugal transfer protein [Croceicoccus naphthovorans]
MMRLPRFFVALFAGLALVGLGAAPARASVTCHGKFVNPITDVCWSCLFPLSIGGLAIWKGSRPDPKNPSFPLCACGSPIPRIGISVGFWEPVRLVDVTNKAWCFPNLGGIRLNPGFDIGNGHVQGRSQVGGKTQNSSQWQAHYYVYPLLYWMEILTDFLCFEQTTFDVAYVTELDPLWQDSALTSIINPEVALFANPVATAACAADCVAATARLPIDQMFWCAGCNGGMYPLNGHVAAHVTPVQASRLVAERKLYKMHREALAWGTMGSKALCHKYLMPVMRKQQYRLQMTNPIPTVKGRYACAPIGATTIIPHTGKSFPVKGEDFGYLVWRKRNCCAL